MAPKKTLIFPEICWGRSQEVNSAYQARFPLNQAYKANFVLKSMHVLLFDSKTQLCHHQVQGCAIV